MIGTPLAGRTRFIWNGTHWEVNCTKWWKKGRQPLSHLTSRSFSPRRPPQTLSVTGLLGQPLAAHRENARHQDPAIPVEHQFNRLMTFDPAASGIPQGPTPEHPRRARRDAHSYCPRQGNAAVDLGASYEKHAPQRRFEYGVPLTAPGRSVRSSIWNGSKSQYLATDPTASVLLRILPEKRLQRPDLLHPPMANPLRPAPGLPQNICGLRRRVQLLAFTGRWPGTGYYLAQ